MNDPHVVALEYRIEHGPDIDWSRAEPLDVQDDRFDIRVENGRVRFDLKEHYATEEDARFSVEADYIPNWEFDVGLKFGLRCGPDVFRLRFDHSEIVDRNRPPDPLSLSVRVSAGVPRVSADLAPPMPPEFPGPPRVAIRRSPDVDSMYQRFLWYLDDREPLAGMAYFCWTVLVYGNGDRSKAARRLGVSNKVLDCIRKLSSYKGGTGARKEDGRNAPYTPEEERFLKLAIKRLIRRAAEVEHEPDRSRTKITKDDILRSPSRGTP